MYEKSTIIYRPAHGDKRLQNLPFLESSKSSQGKRMVHQVEARFGQQRVHPLETRLGMWRGHGPAATVHRSRILKMLGWFAFLFERTA